MFFSRVFVDNKRNMLPVLMSKALQSHTVIVVSQSSTQLCVLSIKWCVLIKVNKGGHHHTNGGGVCT